MALTFLAVCGGTGTSAAALYEHICHALAESATPGGGIVLVPFAHGEDGELVAGQAREAWAERVAEFGTLDSPFVALRTSGSTRGIGSWIFLTEAQLRASARATYDACGLFTPITTPLWISLLPSEHVAGFQTLMRAALTGHRPICLTPASLLDPHLTIPELTGDVQAFLSIVPTQLSQALTRPHTLALLRQMHTVLVGGAATAPHVIDEARAAGVNVVTTYGMTETCGGCVYNSRPLPGVTVEIDDAGRVVLSGPMVTTPAQRGEPRSQIEAAGLHPHQQTIVTQDAGSFDGEILTLHGRVDDVILSGGLTISPLEVEALLGSAGIGEGIAVGVPHPTWGQAVCFISPHTLTRDGVKHRLTQRTATTPALIPAHIPHVYISWEDLGWSGWPMKASGKIDRRAVRTSAHSYLSSKEPHAHSTRVDGGCASSHASGRGLPRDCGDSPGRDAR